MSVLGASPPSALARLIPAKDAPTMTTRAVRVASARTRAGRKTPRADAAVPSAARLAAAPFRKCRRVTRLRSLVVGSPDAVVARGAPPGGPDDPAEVYL